MRTRQCLPTGGTPVLKCAAGLQGKCSPNPFPKLACAYLVGEEASLKQQGESQVVCGDNRIGSSNIATDNRCSEQGEGALGGQRGVAPITSTTQEGRHRAQQTQSSARISVNIHPKHTSRTGVHRVKGDLARGAMVWVLHARLWSHTHTSTGSA